jgi:peptide/nickel transport system substrate-binding protein
VIRARASIKGLVAAVAVTALATTGLVATAVGPAVAQGSGGSKTLNMAFNADMQVPDPDIFYEVEGNEVVTSAYEGLVRYKPDSNEIEGALAESWEVSPDGLVYTFHLRPGVKFQTGGVADADAWIKSFQRRTDVDSAPAYMLADVASTAAPDPNTFVVTLKQPVSPFLDYLAAPYGPKAVDPAIVESKAKGGDFAQGYLKNHTAGTGPYYISKFNLGKQYVLKRNADWWGEQPYFDTVKISIIPEISTQRLALESGDIDLMTHGLPVADVESFKSNSDFEVHEFPVLLKTVFAANPNKGPFKDPALRTALTTYFDKQDIVDEVYKGQAKVSTQMYPVNNLPPELGQDISEFDQAPLKDLVKKLKSKKLDIAYSQDEGGTLPRLAEILGAELQKAGFDPTIRAMPIAQVFELPGKPKKGPDMLLWSFNPDAAHPDTWVRIFMREGGAINYLSCSSPEADAAMDEGLVATDTGVMQAAYGRAGDALAETGCYITLADVTEEVVARKGLTGLVHQLPTAYTIRLADVKESTTG